MFLYYFDNTSIYFTLFLPLQLLKRIFGFLILIELILLFVLLYISGVVYIKRERYNNQQHQQQQVVSVCECDRAKRTFTGPGTSDLLYL